MSRPQPRTPRDSQLSGRETAMALEASMVALLSLLHLSYAPAMEGGGSIFTSPVGSLATDNNSHWEMPSPSLSAQTVVQDCSLVLTWHEVVFEESSVPGLGTVLFKDVGRRGVGLGDRPWLSAGSLRLALC